MWWWRDFPNMTNTGDSTIEIRGLLKRYRDVTALAGIDLEVRKGERFGLIGPDGAGKTTLMRILCGLLLPDEGSFTVLDFDGITQIKSIKRRIGYMPQKFSLYPDLTVGENLRFFSDLFGVRGDARKSRRERLLKFSRLAPFTKRRAGALSGGMKQKLALSCALMHTPDVLILDEPTTGVDPLSRREFWSILTELSENEGTTILVSTPYMDEAERCSRIAFMSEGRMLALGRPKTFIRDFPHAILVVTGHNLPLLADELTDIEGVQRVRGLGDQLRIAADHSDAIRKPLFERLEKMGASDLEIHSGDATLEDVFMEMPDTGVTHGSP